MNFQKESLMARKKDQSQEKSNFFESVNKWHVATFVALLYALVVFTSLFTHQPPEIMNNIFKGAGGVGFLILLILYWGD